MFYYIPKYPDNCYVYDPSQAFKGEKHYPDYDKTANRARAIIFNNIEDHKLKILILRTGAKIQFVKSEISMVVDRKFPDCFMIGCENENEIWYSVFARYGNSYTTPKQDDTKVFKSFTRNIVKASKFLYPEQIKKVLPQNQAEEILTGTGEYGEIFKLYPIRFHFNETEKLENPYIAPRRALTKEEVADIILSTSSFGDLIVNGFPKDKDYFYGIKN